jgi:hypothetical protein
MGPDDVPYLGPDDDAVLVGGGVAPHAEGVGTRLVEEVKTGPQGPPHPSSDHLLAHSPSPTPTRASGSWGVASSTPADGGVAPHTPTDGGTPPDTPTDGGTASSAAALGGRAPLSRHG